MKVKWTAQDQQQLDELKKRKELFDTTYKTKVMNFAEEWAPSALSLSDWLISNADTLRDLLLPFDSGIRPSAVEKIAVESGWIMWEGGDCPVPEGTLVDVQHRDGGVYTKEKAVCGTHVEYWGHTDHSGDIIAYRVCE